MVFLLNSVSCIVSGFDFPLRVTMSGVVCPFCV